MIKIITFTTILFSFVFTASFAQSFTGPTEICNNVEATYTYADDVIYTSINWIFTGGGSSSSPNGLSRVVKWTSSGTVTVNLIRNGVTVSTSTKSVSVFSSGTLSGSTSVCANSSVSLSLTGSFASTINWQYSTNGTTWNLIGSGGSSISHTPPASTTWYRAYVCEFKVAGNVSNVLVVNVFPTPAVYNLTAADGGAYCSGGSGVTFTLNGSQSGYNYQLKSGGTAVGSSVAGTGGVLNWYNLTSAGSYTVTASHASLPSCQAEMSGSPVVSVNVLPNSYNVFGSGSFCEGSNGVYLTHSQSGISYQLKLNGSNYLSPIAGVGGQLFFPVSVSGDFTVMATNTSTGCSRMMNGNASITINPVPQIFNLSIAGSGMYCLRDGPGGSLTLNGSLVGTTYRLRLEGSVVGDPVSGTGSSLTWNDLAAGTYTVTATTAAGCSSTMNGSAVISAHELLAFNTTGGGAFCEGSGSVPVTLAGSETGVNYQLYRSGSILAESPKSGTGGALTWNVSTTDVFTVEATHATLGCHRLMTGSATATADTPSTGGTTTPQTKNGFGQASGSITLSSGYTGTVHRWEVNSGEGWSSVTPANTSLTLNYTNISSNTSYRAVVKNGTCAEAVSSISTVIIHAVPVVTMSRDYIPYGSSVELSTGVYDTYTWFRNNEIMSGATTQTITVTEPAQYKVQVSKAEGSITSAVVTLKSILAQEGYNFRSTTTVLAEGVKTVASLYNLPADNVQQTIEYQDAFGRPFQLVGIGQSIQGSDVIQLVGYGSRGLAETSYLPYISEHRDGSVRTNAIRGPGLSYTASEQFDFYQNTPQVAADTHPYAIKVLTATPSPRLKEQGAAGSAWQPGTGHTVKYDVVLNTGNQVRLWLPDGTTTEYYPENVLIVNQVTDENNNMVRTFSDKMGRTILKQVQLDETIEGVYTPWLETYYIYDELGRLHYTVPPKAMKILGSGTSLDANHVNVAELIYTYSYDMRNRLIMKKIPGASEEHLVYDQLDRLVLMQDGNLRSQTRWAFVKYDQYNRAIYRGVYSRDAQRNTLQDEMDARDYDTEPYYDIEESNPTFHGYSNRVFPTADLSVLSVNYYDHYDFDRNGTPDYSYDNSHLASQPQSASARTRYLSTGSRRVIIDETNTITTDWLVNVVFYDEYDRPVQTQGNNQLYLTVADKMSVLYALGRVVKIKNSHYGSASSQITLTDVCDYDNSC